MTADSTLYVIITITAPAVFTPESRHHVADTLWCHQLPSVHCEQVEVRHAVPAFIQHLTVWSVEPAVTHQTSGLESIGECDKRQHQAGEVSAPTRASCPAAGSLGQTETSAALRQYVFNLKNQAAHLLCQLWVKQQLHKCMVLPA